MLDVKLRTALQTELQPVKDDIRDLKEHVQSLENRMDSLEVCVKDLQDEVHALDGRVSKVENQVSGIRLTLENKTNRDIRLLADNYIPAARQYEHSAAQIESIQTDLNLVKKVVIEHSKKLEKLA